MDEAESASVSATNGVITATGVVKRWGDVTALDGVTAVVPRGITGLLGPNGAGKTTMLGMVLGLHRPDEGSLRVLDLDPQTSLGGVVEDRQLHSVDRELCAVFVLVAQAGRNGAVVEVDAIAPGSHREDVEHWLNIEVRSGW